MLNSLFVQQLNPITERRLCVSSNFVTDDDVNLAWVDRIATPSVCFHKPASSTQQQYLLTYSQFRRHITLLNTVLFYLILIVKSTLLGLIYEAFYVLSTTVIVDKVKVSLFRSVIPHRQNPLELLCILSSLVSKFRVCFIVIWQRKMCYKVDSPKIYVIREMNYL
jgi:hypothetical protein